MAARLALAGLTGPETAIEGNRGLFAAFARDQAAAGRLEAHLADCGSRWHIADVAFKFLPCCHYLHPFAEGARQMQAEIGDIGGIESLTLRIAERAAPIVCEPWAIKLAPADGHAARWSLPVVVAMQLVENRVDLDSFDRPVCDAVLALARRCRWEPLEPNRFPDAFEAELVCALADGRVLRRMIPDVFGNVSRPASQADVLDKFRANAGRALTPAGVAALERVMLGADAPDFATSPMRCEAAALKEVQHDRGTHHHPERWPGRPAGSRADDLRCRPARRAHPGDRAGSRFRRARRAHRHDRSLAILPGAIDPHLHLGHGKDISRPRVAADADQETAAAAVGGVTSFIPYLMSTEPYDQVFDEVRAITEAGSRIDFRLPLRDLDRSAACGRGRLCRAWACRRSRSS